jgi:hypothetical protein
MINEVSIERREGMDYNKIEDGVMKKAMEFFQENAVDFFALTRK